MKNKFFSSQPLRSVAQILKQQPLYHLLPAPRFYIYPSDSTKRLTIYFSEGYGKDANPHFINYLEKTD